MVANFSETRVLTSRKHVAGEDMSIPEWSEKLALVALLGMLISDGL